MTFIDSIHSQLQAMNTMEPQQAISSLRDLVYEDAYTNTTHPTMDDEVPCPRCGSLSIVHKGLNHDGNQRWLCKDNHRMLPIMADTIITRSKLRPSAWMRHLECFVDCLPLCEHTSRCHVSLHISWLMRSRLIESIRHRLPCFRSDAGCTVQPDETYLREKSKGYYKRGKFNLPRPAHLRGTHASKHRLSKEEICVMTGVSDDGSTFLTMSGPGLLPMKHAVATLDGKLASGIIAVTDKTVAHPVPTSTLGVALTWTEADDHAINRVNTLHSLFHGFLGEFRA